MKKACLFVLTMLLLLSLAGCAEPIYQVPHDQFCYAHLLPTDQTREVKLAAEEKQYIIELLNGAQWIDSLTNCSSDFTFYTQAQEVRYHAECGTFNDITNQRAATLTEEQRQVVNRLLGV